MSEALDQAVTAPAPFVPLGLRARPARAPEPHAGAPLTITARAPGQRRNQRTVDPHLMVTREPPRPPTLLDWAGAPDERGAGYRIAARAWAAAKLLMLATTLALGGTLAFVLAAVRFYSWMRHSGS